MSIQHDAFGTLNPDTGGLDYINTNYVQSDSLHLNQAGYDFWAPLLVNTLGDLYPAPHSMTIGTLTIGAPSP